MTDDAQATKNHLVIDLDEKTAHELSYLCDWTNTDRQTAIKRAIRRAYLDCGQPLVDPWHQR